MPWMRIFSIAVYVLAAFGFLTMLILTYSWFFNWWEEKKIQFKKSLAAWMVSRESDFLKTKNEMLEDETKTLRKRVDTLNLELDKLKEERDDLQEQLEIVRSSNSHYRRTTTN